MRVPSFLSVALTMFFGIEAACAEVPLVRREGVGPVTIGSRAEAIYDDAESGTIRLVDLRLEGMLSPALEIRLPGTTRSDAVVAELRCRDGLVVWRITVKDPALRTAEGIGPGSTVGELRKRFGDLRLVSGEGLFGLFVPKLAVSVEVDMRSVPSYRTRDPREHALLLSTPAL